ncbi:molybdenum cofactor biosynthesis protein B [Virgibacillus sp. SK37]|uniref:MogA/MoaB family molybdenum cofactor biosynthesis protein n=1 Tax=Virgibacillus sp. SK37 TaxID=403957 RepID=UPI0004D1BB31|nr:molybdenum cofactor biosynthesis protein B [Virgibacillus sp. SK37]AIF43196.1 molybdenum cofactor biosynthesis protein B [Virgibacillus sp. SK37]
MSVTEHKQNNQPVNCMIITVSDTRTVETDKSGNLMQDLLEQAGHHVVMREIVPDEYSLIQKAVRAGCDHPHIEVVLTNGGTGIAGRDVTIEAVTAIFEKEIPGFGEIFRYLSYKEDIGSAAILSRAVAGVLGQTAIISTPGSSGAVKLAMNKLIIPEISHMSKEIKKDYK